MSIWDNLISRINNMQEALAAKPDFRWGVVVSTSPLAVQLDGDSQPLAGMPANTAGTLSVGVRVLCLLQHRKVTVVSKAGGLVAASAAEIAAGTLSDKYVSPAGFAAGVRQQPNSLLWSGALMMSAGHRAQLSQPVAAQANGIVLIWGRIDGGRTYEFDFQTHFIPKGFLAGVASREFTFPVIVGDALGRKVFYVYNDRIEGHQLSGQPGNNYWVLRYVYGI